MILSKTNIAVAVAAALVTFGLILAGLPVWASVAVGYAIGGVRIWYFVREPLRERDSTEPARGKSVSSSAPRT